MRAVGLEPSDDELANMITEVDGSGKGAVDFAGKCKRIYICRSVNLNVEREGGWGH